MYLQVPERLVPVGEGRYRPLVERSFARIIKLDDSWEVTTKDGVRFILGKTSASRLEHDDKIFAWVVESAIDTHGNEIHYLYHKDGNQIYLEEIHYSIYRVRIDYEIRPDYG